MTAYVGHYIDKVVVERRLSKAVLRRGYDDNNDGAADEDVVNQLLFEAESMFEGRCRGKYTIDALRAAKPTEAVRICLDIVDYLIAKRFPRSANRSWTELETSVLAELKLVANGEIRLDVDGLPSPPSNVGGDVFSGTSSEVLDPIAPIYQDDWGSF